MRILLNVIIAMLVFSQASGQTSQTATVSLPNAGHALDGRVLFLLSNDASAEPRMQIDDTPKSQMVFGVTVDGLKPGRR